MLKKLTSRKLWTMVAGLVTGIAMMFGVTDNDISTISGTVISIGSVLGYFAVEGFVDVARAKNNVNTDEIQKTVIATIEKLGTMTDPNEIDIKL